VIGSRTFIGHRCEFIIQSSIHIGDDCLFASGCRFTDINHQISDLTRPINVQPCVGTPIHIENNVWMGVNVIVLSGVTIGTGSVVGAGSVVTKSIPANEIWVGVPAKKIGERR
jgi:acetyltransferase-like isoleucine patch superfamily enzyme